MYIQNTGAGAAAGAALGTAFPGVGTGIGAAGGALLGFGADAYNTYQQHKAKKEEIQRYEDRLKYDSPAAQAKRFREAGFNPHVIYGQINSGTGTAMPNVTPPRFDGQNLIGSVQAMGQLAQIQNLIAQNENIYAQNSLINSQAQYQEAKRIALINKLPHEVQQIIATTASKKATTIKTGVETATGKHDLAINKAAHTATNSNSTVGMVGRWIGQILNGATTWANAYNKKKGYMK